MSTYGGELDSYLYLGLNLCFLHTYMYVCVYIYFLYGLELMFPIYRKMMLYFSTELKAGHLIF